MKSMMLTVFALAAVAAGCSRSTAAESNQLPAAQRSDTAAAPAAATKAVSTASVRAVESKRVCMINNRLMNEDQIPVTVGDKTYFGCCPMCKERLENDQKSRTATDPISGRQVDKALAVIGARPSGQVVYFESLENLKAYAAQ